MSTSVWITDEDGIERLVNVGSEAHKEYEFQEKITKQINQKISNNYIKNQMKKGKITKCQYSREWNGPSGTIYYHNIALDNGDAGSVGTKEKMPPKIAEGAEVWYTIEQKGQFKGVAQYSIKLEKAPDQQYQSKSNNMSNQSNNNQQENIARSVALKAAIDAVGAGEQPSVYINVALYFEHYLLTGQQANQDAVDNALNDRKMDAGHGIIQNFREDEIRHMDNDLPF